MPCDYSNYPANWRSEIRPAILQRAFNLCEECGAEHHSIVLSKSRQTLTGAFDSYREARDAVDFYHEPGDRAVVIVLTIAHLDHDTTNNDHANLRALCQRCHLQHDAGHHRRNASRTRARYCAEQLDLFPALS